MNNTNNNFQPKHHSLQTCDMFLYQIGGKKNNLKNNGMKKLSHNHCSWCADVYCTKLSISFALYTVGNIKICTRILSKHLLSNGNEGLNLV